MCKTKLLLATIFAGVLKTYVQEGPPRVVYLPAGGPLIRYVMTAMVIYLKTAVQYAQAFHGQSLVVLGVVEQGYDC